MNSDLPEVVSVALEGPGVVALLLSLHPQLVLEVLVGGQLALHLDAPASLQSHLHTENCREDRFISVLDQHYFGKLDPNPH